MKSELQEMLCEQWCADLEIGQDAVGTRLSLPLTEADGDSVTVWINEQMGGWRLRDCGTTFMRLSYDIDVDILSEGQRAKVIARILSEHRVEIEDGEIIGNASDGELGQTLMRFGQAMLRIGDLKLWSRARVANTFYDDLQATLLDIVGPTNLVVDYQAPNVPDSANYLVDYAVLGLARPLYIFGVPSSDKAKLATIVLLHLQKSSHSFDSLIIPSDIESIGKPDLRRLLNVANDFVDSSASTDAIERKIQQRMGA